MIYLFFSIFCIFSFLFSSNSASHNAHKAHHQQKKKHLTKKNGSHGGGTVSGNDNSKIENGPQGGKVENTSGGKIEDKSSAGTSSNKIGTDKSTLSLEDKIIQNPSAYFRKRLSFPLLSDDFIGDKGGERALEFIENFSKNHPGSYTFVYSTSKDMSKSSSIGSNIFEKILKHVLLHSEERILVVEVDENNEHDALFINAFKSKKKIPNSEKLLFSLIRFVNGEGTLDYNRHKTDMSVVNLKQDLGAQIGSSTKEGNVTDSWMIQRTKELGVLPAKDIDEFKKYYKIK